MTLEPGWLKRQVDEVTEEVRHWPQSLKRNGGLPYNANCDPNKSDAELELEAEIARLKRTVDARNYQLEYGDSGN